VLSDRSYTVAVTCQFDVRHRTKPHPDVWVATKACRTTGGCVKTDMEPRISRRSRSPQSCRKTVQHLALLSGFKCLPKPVDPHELTSVIARHGTNPVDSDVVAIRGA
jgi:hypothetical protein